MSYYDYDKSGGISHFKKYVLYARKTKKNGIFCRIRFEKFNRILSNGKIKAELCFKQYSPFISKKINEGGEAGQGQAGDGLKTERLNIGAKYIFLKKSIKNPAPKRAGFTY